MDPNVFWRALIPVTAGIALAVSLFETKSYGAISFGAFVAGLTVIMRNRKWVWRLPALYFSVAGLDYFYRVFGGMEPNTPGLLSSGDFEVFDAVVLVLCIASVVACAIASFRREKASS